MNYFYQGAAMVLLSVLVCLVLNKQAREFSVVISIGVCSMIMLLAAAYLEPMVSFLRELEALAHLDEGMMGILFKVAGIGILSEIAGIVCADSGNASMGKVLHILSTAVILWLSIPIFRELLGLIEGILGEV